MRIGLLGGTFDPIHQGHLDVADAARAALNLSSIWFIPARMPPHRHQPHASSAHRFAMVALATAHRPELLVSDLEMERSGPSYTIDTLTVAAERLPTAATPFFIIGADAFADVGSWRAFPAVVDRCHFVVVSRPGRSALTLGRDLPTLADRMLVPPCPVPPSPSVFLVDASTADVSSTAVRRRIATHEPAGPGVPTAVADYIAKHQLYSDPEHRYA